MKDYLIISGMFLFTLLANLWGFKTSLQRQRDIERVLNIGNIEAGLKKYFSEYAVYPVSDSKGRIVACADEKSGYQKDENGSLLYKTGAKKPTLINLVACEWGKDRLGDITDINYPAYLELIPNDPKAENGINYRYESDGKYFVIYARFELKETSGYDKNIRKLNLFCGHLPCNTARKS